MHGPDTTQVSYKFVFIYSFCFFDLLQYFINPLQTIWVVQLSKATETITAALPIPTSECSIFMCPNNGTVASVWDLQ